MDIEQRLLRIEERLAAIEERIQGEDRAVEALVDATVLRGRTEPILVDEGKSREARRVVAYGAE